MLTALSVIAWSPAVGGAVILPPPWRAGWLCQAPGCGPPPARREPGWLLCKRCLKRRLRALAFMPGRARYLAEHGARVRAEVLAARGPWW